MEQPPVSRWGHAWRLMLMILVSAVVSADTLPDLWDTGGAWRVAIDVVVGCVAYVVVHVRRRYPLPVAVATTLIAAVSAVAAGPAVLATVSVATLRIYWQLAIVAALSAGSAVVFYQVMPTQSGEPGWVSVSVTLIMTLALIGWGMYIGSRRELMFTIVQRAERAESERDLRIGKAQADERARIAREMHDVLAHRISQISMHAGALSFRNDLDTDSLRAGIADVQARANEALNDLRSVLGVLRDPETGAAQQTPQPTFDDVPALIDSASHAGAQVTMLNRVSDGPVPINLGRTLYRIVQEGITNAQKHAPKALLTVDISGDETTGVTVVMSNPRGVFQSAPPGAGLGLVGLAERSLFAGGNFESGFDGSSFVVTAWLPWLE